MRIGGEMKKWVLWQDNCPECGNDIEIETDATEEGCCFDGDAVRCVGCSFKSMMTVYEDGTCEIQQRE